MKREERRSGLGRFALLAATWLVLLAPASAALADWTATGRFEYTDRLYDLSGFTGTAALAAREADVEVYDLGSSAVLATGSTDSNGDFSIFVVDAATRDVGVRALASTDETASLNFSVVDDASGDAVYVYHDVSADQSGHGSSSDVNFGTMTMPAAIGSVGSTDWSSQVFNTFDMLLLMADWIASVDGSRPAIGLSVGWNPTNGRGGSFYNGGVNRVSLSDDDGYDDPNILHEIGHYVEDEFGFSQNTGGSHSIGDDDQDPRLSFSEGLATFFSNASLEEASRPRPDIYCDRDSFGVSGGGGFAYQLESAVSGGSTNEQAVNAALWDIIDTATSLDASPATDDDPMSDSHANVWDTIEQLRVDAPPNMQLEDFWETWFALALGSQTDMEATFAGHQIDFAPDSQEPNGTPATATVLTVGGPYQENSFYRGVAPAGGDEDWFRFPVTSGSYYRVQVNGAANSLYGRPDPELFLLDQDLAPLAFSDDPYDTSLNDQSNSTAQDMDETSPVMLFRAAATGDHYAYLRHASYPLNLDGRYGTYQVRVQDAGSPTPTVDDVSAQRMLQGESYQALVVGSNFALGATVGLSDAGLVVSGVDWISPTALVATIGVDGAVVNGSYSLTVSNPGAGSDVFGSAVEVTSSAQPPVVVSELELGFDKVEVRNLGVGAADLAGWELRSYRPGFATSSFTFPSFTLPAGATVVVSEATGTDTATELFAPGGFNWPWFNGAGGGLSLVDDGGRNVDYIRFVDSFVDEHEAPLGSGGLWMQPELLSPGDDFTLSRSETASLYRSRFGLSAADRTMPNGSSGRDNAVDAWEDNDAARRARLFASDVAINGLAISPRPAGSDDDWFGFVLSAGEAVDFDVTFTHSAGDLDIELYPPGEEAVAIVTANSATDDESISLTGALTTTHGAGVYRLRVHGVSGATNSYSLAAATVGGGLCGDGTLDPGEACDDGNTTPGDCCSAMCQIELSGTVCRASADVCDVAEVCDGIADVCPTDAFEPATTECRGAAGACDAADFCDGLGVACTADVKLTTECRSAADVCDVAEVCDGVADLCPTDAFEPVTTECRGSAGACDAADFCDGLGVACTADVKLTSECRASADVCDVAEVCDGVADVCPTDAFEPATTECRGSAGACDAADFCDGLGVACTADVKLTSECRASADVCDVAEVCDGVADLCPTDAFEPATTECRGAAGACDAADFCDGLGVACTADVKLTSECRASADVCDVAEVCDGVADLCPTDAFEPATTECRGAAGACDAADFCDGLGVACTADGKLTSECRSAADVCDVAEVCDGVADLCPTDAFEPATTECRGSAGACDAADFCDGLGVACTTDVKLTSECRASADVCDVAEVCDGIADLCPTDAFEPATTECRGAAGACDAADFCDGLGVACTADVKLTSECRASADVCDVAEVCDGVADLCPTDAVEPATTECRGSAGACDAADFCDGLGVACTADVKLTSECRASADVCDVAEVCDGVADLCPTDAFEPATTECRGAAGICDAADFCDGLGVACTADVKLTSECRSAADICDIAEVCDGVADLCPTDAFEPATTECRGAAGMCDAADFCDGLSAACTADAKLTTECRSAADLCDAIEFCDGVADSCPADGLEPATTECRPSIGVCDDAELCDGLVSACPVDQPFSGLPCLDGDVCNGDEVCDQLAACVPGVALDCDDHNVCTAESCDEITGCAHTPIQGCVRQVPAGSLASRAILALLLMSLGGIFHAHRARSSR